MIKYYKLVSVIDNTLTAIYRQGENGLSFYHDRASGWKSSYYESIEDFQLSISTQRIAPVSKEEIEPILMLWELSK
jgi:hypothetical protein